TDLLTAAQDAERATPEEVANFVITLFVGGHQTTVNGIALSIVALLRNPAQWRLLIDHPELLTNAVEELLRYDNTIQVAWRTTPADYEVGDVTIPAGVHVLGWTGSANRDPAKWGDSAD